MLSPTKYLLKILQLKCLVISKYSISKTSNREDVSCSYSCSLIKTLDQYGFVVAIVYFTVTVSLVEQQCSLCLWVYIFNVSLEFSVFQGESLLQNRMV